jgi:hypothetical protein
VLIWEKEKRRKLTKTVGTRKLGREKRKARREQSARCSAQLDD